MEKKVVEILGLVLRLFIRYWARDSKVLGQNLVDIEQFALQCGLSIWEAKKFNRSIDEYIDIIAEDFLKEIGTEIKDAERKEEILNQIREDFKHISDSSVLTIALSNPEELRSSVMSNSQKIRCTWSELENGMYINSVRYLSKVYIDFISKLPGFTPEALKLIIKRQDIYQKELIDILENIHSMTKLIKNVDEIYQEYEEVYRDKLINKYSKVELIGAGLRDRNVTRYDISSSYVELNCINNDYDYDNEIELSQVFASNNIVWIKGEAGSGKTTFLQWIAVCAAKNEYHKIHNIENTLPIVIGLRSVEWPLNLQDIVNKITGTFGYNCPEGWILELLQKNKVILLFDGLDEINQTKREETYQFIEDMVEQYPKIRILLTARNSVNDYLDCECVCYEIMPMKIDNIKRFILYWHRSVLWRDAVINDDEINELQRNLIMKIVNNQPLKALAKNPLLCAMICALNYTNNEQLPNNKMELYDKCCEMLIDARDNQRHIDSAIYENVPKMDYTQKRKILEEMAYWMLSGGESSEEKRTVVGFIEHLMKDTNIFVDKDKQFNPEAILNFFIERSGLIREPEDEKVDFIHKTFMEFLAVKTICRNCAWNVLVKEACNVNWKETIVMCFHEMSKENVESVLKRMILEAEWKGDDRYILMASLGASNAMFSANDELKQKIDKHIKEMIPPKRGEMYEIGEAGTYLLPFLINSKEYTKDEMLRCLILLDYLETDEIIPDILTYILENDDSDVVSCALDILCKYNEDFLEEYNVKDELLNSMLKSISNGSLTTYESMLNILGDMEVSAKNIDDFNRIKSLIIFGGITEDSLYYDRSDLLWYLKHCEKVRLINVQDIRVLSKFANITDLEIEISEDSSEIISRISSYKNLTSIKNLKIKVKELNYLCENDFKNMRYMETLEINCHDSNLEIDFDGFKDFLNLKKVNIYVDSIIELELCEKIKKWHRDKPSCEFILG